MKNKKKILAAAGILVLAGVAAVCYIQNRDKKEAASIGIIGGADGPTKIFLAGKIGSPDEETRAAVLDLETAKKQSYGDVTAFELEIDQLDDNLTKPTTSDIELMM